MLLGIQGYQLRAYDIESLSFAGIPDAKCGSCHTQPRNGKLSSNNDESNIKRVPSKLFVCLCIGTTAAILICLSSLV